MSTLPELRINGSSTVYQDYGVRMGEGFLDALTEPLSLKENIENESRLEHGKRVVVEETPKYASRDVILDFTITGKTPDDFRTKKNAFLALMYKGKITLQVPQESDDVYHLIYRGKGSDYSMNPQRTFCHMMLKFEEPDPSKRTL
jgi:hypothetical protein|nr:MAG TPA: tail protein [Caudoviricetes sp.]